MDALAIIKKKRDGQRLSRSELSFLIEGYTTKRIPDYQMSAFLMASQLRGMSPEETIVLTELMLKSGRVLDFGAESLRVIDKHSTGGVGDSVSMILAPIVGSCGVRIPMISGRALGHTGGTLDKLEAIPGLRTNLSISEIYQQIQDLGVVMIGATQEITPADRLLYALRDVTASVDFIPFITASILSKKLAEGLSGLVLDVKSGRGAFMTDSDQSRKLAETLVMVGEYFGMTTIALLTNMDQPLGRAIGNWLEVEESIECLKGQGSQELLELSLTLSGEMIALAGLADDPSKGMQIARDAVSSGRALDFFAKIVSAQGGDPKVITNPTLRMRSIEPVTVNLPLDIHGFVTDIDAYQIAEVANNLGAGRLVIDDEVDHEAGIVLHLSVGDRVTPGLPIASIFGRNADLIDASSQKILDAFQLSESPVKKPDLIIDRLTSKGWTSES